ncbi:MAG: lanthionine synthetase C family protein [Ktedonobacteraceae bacterium]|nr:lanthionine synthetase C family protein [Ktedonobacteraceae bacterium]
MQEYPQSGDALIHPGAAESFYQWQSTIDEPLRCRALEAIYVVAERLREPGNAIAIAQVAAQQAMLFSEWGPASRSCGFGSTALLFLYIARSFPDRGWEEVARHHLRLAAESTHQHPLVSPGIFGGSSGLATIVSLFRHDDSRYHNTWKAFNVHVATQVLENLWRREDTKGVAEYDYDVISGAAGILGYLVTIDQPDDSVRTATQTLLEYLIWLVGSDHEDERKRWFLPPELYPTELYLDNYPDGYFNCGLAHGIPGPLAALAVAWHAGYRLPRQREAMHSLSHWMVEHQLCDEWGINWPSGVPLQASYSADEWNKLYPTRTAWCYGSPGIARTLWLAGTALNDATLCQIAVEAITSVLRRPIAARRIDSVTFCHGVAGLLTICLRFAHETSSALVRQHIPLLVKQILDTFNPDYPLGFRDLEREHNWVDDPGLLTGAVGVALALLAASTSTEPDWDRIFLIS